jgi:hypothetical protein
MPGDPRLSAEESAPFVDPLAEVALDLPRVEGD